MNHILSPSLLSADFGNLQRDIEMINQSQADWFHVDIMDGHFVPNLSIGFPVLKVIAQHARKPLDIHLMIENPDNYIERFVKEAKADYLTVHYEACKHLHRTVSYIRSFGVKAGVSLNPHSSVSLLEDILPYLDLVLLMSVNPGFGGQAFIEQTIAKTQKLADMTQKIDSKIIIEIDGGVDLNNYRRLLAAGANALVCGNSIFAADDPIDTIVKLKTN